MILLHHLGLGDHIICNGMVRHFYKTCDKLVLVVAENNLKNVAYMFKDLPNIEYLKVKSHKDVDYLGDQITRIGFDKLDSLLTSMTFDEAFYHLAGLDFSVRFDQFFYKRDTESENCLIQELNESGEPYIFVHDAPDKGYNISLPETHYKVIRNDHRFLLFDYITLLENAEEIHFMQSSFKEMICSFKLIKPKLYQHNYVRSYPSYLNSKGLNKIFEINSPLEISA